MKIPTPEELAAAFSAEGRRGMLYRGANVPTVEASANVGDLFLQTGRNYWFRREPNEWVRVTINNASRAEALLMRFTAWNAARARGIFGCHQ